MMDEWEDAARAGLEGWLYAAEELLEWVDRPTSTMSAEDRSELRSWAKNCIAHCVSARHAKNTGNPWKAAYHAMLAGLAEGHLQAHPLTATAQRDLAAARLKLSRKGSRGERQYDAAALARSVVTLRARTSHMSDTQIAKTLARMFAPKSGEDKEDTALGGRRYRSILDLMKRHKLLSPKKTGK